MDDAARALIEELRLEPHPEGGFYRETFRSPVEVAAHGGTPVSYTHLTLPTTPY